VERLNEAELAKLNAKLSRLDLRDRLSWADQTYGDSLAIVTSFGPSGIVILDHMVKVRPDAHVMTLDTHFLFPETYALIREIREYYRTIHLEVLSPNLTAEQQALKYGEELWKSDPDLCCFLRKVVPLADGLADKSAWISGIRRDQSRTRKHTPLIQWDTRNDLVKLSPVADWTERQVWGYIKQHHLPYNTLHDKNFPSIGCMQCTQPTQPGEDLRAGRWDGTGKIECGLHIDLLGDHAHRHTED
jgi:phosphoadenosine phosphosulfate reductase